MGNKKIIDDLIDFCTESHSLGELAALKFPGFPATRLGFFLRMRRLGLKRRRRQDRRGFGFSFFDFPASWQRLIVIFFIQQHRTKRTRLLDVSEKEIDALLFTCASRNLEFALFWRKREKRRYAVEDKIFKLLQGLK